MTIKTSGVLSFLDIINEPHSYGTDMNAYYNQNWWTDTGGYGRFKRTELDFQYFYGKRFTPPFACGTGIVQVIGQQRQCPGVNTYYLPGPSMDVYSALSYPADGTWVVVPVFFGSPTNLGKDNPGFFASQLAINEVVEVYLQINKPAAYYNSYLLPNSGGTYNVPYAFNWPYSGYISFGTLNSGLRYDNRIAFTSRVFPDNFSFIQNEAAIVKWDTGTTDSSFQHIVELEWDGYTARVVARAWGNGGIFSDTLSMGICGAAIVPGVGAGPANGQAAYIENGSGTYNATPSNSGRYKVGPNCIFTGFTYSQYMSYTNCPAFTQSPASYVYVPDPCPVIDTGNDSGTGDPNGTGGGGPGTGTDGSGGPE